MAKKEMTPAEANELLNGLAIARAACAKAQDRIDHCTDLYDQLTYTLKHIDETYDSAMAKFLPASLLRVGEK